ncbi:MAG: hypothetical protein AAF628_10885 [Planctomycetota bacterium]
MLLIGGACLACFGHTPLVLIGPMASMLSLWQLCGAGHPPNDTAGLIVTAAITILHIGLLAWTSPRRRSHRRAGE